LAREHREADLIYAFHIARERALMPDGADVAVDDAHRGKTFVWWDQVLAGLVTKTQIKEYGRKPAKDTKPFAHIQYGRGRRERRYDLYSIADAIPIRAAAANAAAVAAEMAYWQRLGHRADENHDYDDEEDERCRVRKDRSRYTEVPVTDYDYDGVPF
jgi:hypothetical protein